MGFVYNLVLVLHILAIAALVGGAIVQAQARGEYTITEPMIGGARGAFVTGLILAGMAEGIDDLDKDIPAAKLATKLLVVVVILALAEVNKKKQPIPNGLYYLLGGLALANVSVAIFWT